MTLFRNDGRAENQLRPIYIQYDLFGHAHASVLFELGGTKVLVSVTLQPNVPPFLKGQRVGWLAAEYSMLPCATHQRTQRDSSQVQKNPRGVEISRLIGRSLRSVLDLEKLGERTIWVDCDVLQADGGTRVACLSAASIALELAVKRWLLSGTLKENIIKESIAAISVGVVNGVACLDLAYNEDSSSDADFNFVMTKSGCIVEVQGTSEKAPITSDMFDTLRFLALKGISDVFSQSSKFVLPISKQESQLQKSSSERVKTVAAPLFSLANRIKQA